MIPFFPKKFANQAIYLYFSLLAVISVLFHAHAMYWYWYLFGAVEVVGFFYFINVLPLQWGKYSATFFEKKLFISALTIRIIYVLFSYSFYYVMTGTPFEFDAADVRFYDEMGKFGHIMISEYGRIPTYTDFLNFAHRLSFSDCGYPYWLTLIYTLTDDSIIITRLAKAVISAYMCVLMYRLSARNFGEATGRLAAIMCMLMPNLIYYCGIHLKETEMVFLLVLFTERADYALHASKQIDWKCLGVALAAALCLFAFRTALGAVALLSLGAMLVLSSGKVLSMWKKTTVGALLSIGLIMTAGGQIYQETMDMVQEGDSAQQSNMEWRSQREGGNSFARYAGMTVFAPLIFTIPFPTTVNLDFQQNQQMINGGCFVKNIVSGFTIYALVLLLLSGDWRKHVLPESVMCGYLIVLTLSTFAQSERFHIPILPFELMFAAYGIAHIRLKDIHWYQKWLVLIFIANIGWAWFKLKGRGMI